MGKGRKGVKEKEYEKDRMMSSNPRSSWLTGIVNKRGTTEIRGIDREEKRRGMCFVFFLCSPLLHLLLVLLATLPFV